MTARNERVLVSGPMTLKVRMSLTPAERIALLPERLQEMLADYGEAWFAACQKMRKRCSHD